MEKFKMVKHIFCKKLDSRGITLIELIVATSISMIVVLLSCTVFVFSTKLYKSIQDGIEVQQQGQFIMDFMVSKIYNSNKISFIKDYNNIERYNYSEKVMLREIWFKDNSIPDKKGHLFSIQKDLKVEGHSIRYGNDKPITIEAGNYIDYMYVKPLPLGSMYSEANGIEIEIMMKKGNSKMEFLKRIYFRNLGNDNKTQGDK